MRERESAGEEATGARVVGVVGGGKECRAADVELIECRARLVAPEFGARHGPRDDDAARRDVADRLRFFVELDEGVGCVETRRKSRRRREAQEESALRARVARGVVAVNAARDV